jgi:Domain of unknown function (DUF4389)
MSTAVGARPAQPGRGAGKILLLVFGSILGLVALALLAGGAFLVWADQTQRDDDGYFTTTTERFATPAYAITHEGVELGDVDDTPEWVLDRFGSVRVRASGDAGERLFVGIGPEPAVTAYLAGVAHAEADEFDPDDLQTTSGSRPRSLPGRLPFWVASASGVGEQVLDWEVDSGTWSLVVMNADGSAPVVADVELGANPDWVLELGFVVLGIGLLAAIGAATMIFFGARSPGGGAGGAIAAPLAAPLAAQPAESTYPVAVEARLDEPLSRWLWLVKWFLAIPHFFLLAFLWIAFALLTVIAFFGILFTGRYPASIFDFNVGVLRWTWRVGWYAISGIGTDRYPPFSLGPEPDYPATLDVPYPERLSRGLVLVKSWLLAIPHLIVVGIFTGSVTWVWAEDTRIVFPGLIGLLTFVAGVILLFRGRYSRDLYELLVGLNRWVYRVIAYVALMRDEYPPFRLGR